MSSVLLSKAIDHYRHKRYELAATEFAAANLERESEARPLLSSSPSSVENGSNSTPTSSSQGILFIDLPKFSIAADAALCRFRSSMANAALGQDQTALLLKAREANEDYGIALEGAIESLASISRKLADMGGFSNRYQFVINKVTVETSMAVLMTAVSGVWLYLHGAESEVTCNRMISRRIIEKGMRLASCCFLGLSPKLFLPTYEEGLEVIDNVIKKVKELSPQDESQVERLEYVFHNIRHTSRIIGLTSNEERRINCKLENHEGTSERKRKRSKHQDMKVANKRTKRTESDRLENQENIVLILKQYIDKQDNTIDKLHVSSHSLKQHSRDSFSQSALEIRTYKVPGQLKSLLQGLDILSGNINSMGNHAVTFSSLESQSLVSKDAAFILGCIHMKLGDLKKATQNFTSVLKLNRSPNRCNGMEKDTLSNIALCFALSGNLVPCLEVLLHRFGIDESENTHRGIRPLQAELQPQMQNHDTSDMGKHLSVIWQIFFAGSLLGDWGVCRKVLKELKEMSICNDYISLANAYVDLESKDLTKRRIQSKPVFTPTARFTEKAFLIYSAEFLKYLNEDDEYSAIDKTALTQIHSMTSALLTLSQTDRSEGKSPHGLLQATILNNNGFALVLNGKAVEAAPFFLEATKLCDQDDRGCSLPIHNLCFLLCQQGQKSEASQLYLKSKW